MNVVDEYSKQIEYADKMCSLRHEIPLLSRLPRPIAQRKILVLNIKYLSEQCGICITVEHETGSAVHFISRIYERRTYRRVPRS